MTHPKFAVGEEVILESKDQPWLNGEYVVHEIVFGRKPSMCRLFGQLIIYKNNDDFGYKLSLVVRCPRDPRIEMLWCESALRKKHQPGQSFQSLMAELTNAKPKLLEKK